MKSIIALAALLLTTSASAQETAEKFAITYQLDGQESTAQAAGTVVGSISGSTATLTVTPAEGNYITKDQITVIKTIPGDNAQTRTPSVSSPVEITASSTTADPSGVTTYTFDASDAIYSYEVTANFLSRKDVADALIQLLENELKYNGGEAIEPKISVTFNSEALTADKDYTVAYSNNTNAGQGVVTITGIGMYKGEKSGNFVIKQASVAIWFEKADGSEAKELETTFGTTFTEPVLKLDPAGVIEVTYSVNDESVATINPSTGKLTILKPGTVVVTAAAKENYTNKEGSNYEADPTSTQASYSLTINKATPTLAFSKETATATMGQAFTAPTLNNPNNLALTYSSSKETVATISEEGVVTIVGEGETTIKATFAGNDTYEAAEASYTLTVSKDKATLAYSVQTATATMGQAFTAPTLSNPNNLALTYSSSKETVATISEEGVVTIVGEGETTIKATFAGNDTYEAAEASYTLTVSKDKATLAYSVQTATATMGQAFTAPTLNNPNSLAVTYSSSKETVATISAEGVVTIVGEGETTIKATFAGNDTYEPAEASYTLTVSKDKATLAYSVQTATATMGQAFTAPTLNNPNSLAVTYSSSKETVATISAEGVVTIVGEGETTIKATFAGNDTYEAAEASYTLTVSKDKATLAYSVQTATATMGQAFTAPTLNNPNNLALTYSSSKETVATISEEGVVTIVGEGETTIKATFAGNDTYEAAEASYTLTVSKDKATLAYSVQTATATMGQAFTAPTLNNPNSLAVTYSSSKETVATISEEGVVTIVGEGETTIKATFAGNETYEFAEASYTLTVSKDKATLAYSAQTATATMGQAFTAPTLNNPNSLAVTYSSSKETVATISEEGVVTIVGEGETVIKATFAGNDTYEAAEASYTLTVSKAAPEKMTVSATGFEGAYDKEAHSITVTVTSPEGAVVKYGTTEGTYDLTENPTYTEAGTYTVYYQVTKDGYETTTGSATVKISKATPIVTAPTAKENLTYTGEAQELISAGSTTGGELQYSLDNAIYSKNIPTGTEVNEYTVYYKVIGGTNYEDVAAASIKVTISRAAGEGYLLWVNDTQVTSDNAEDVLGHKTDSSKPYYIYNKDENKLTMDNDQTRTTVIESRMPELTVYIKDANKIKSIFFNNTGDTSNKGNLTFTTNGNFPGKLIIANPTKGESAIKGFSNISYNWDLTAIEPDGSYYDTTTLKMMYKDETETPVIADAITIGEAIVPITEKRAITFEESQLVEKDEDGKVKKDESGNPIKANLSNYSYAPSSTTGEPEKNVIHISLNSANISDDAGGFDIENGVGGIYIEDTMTDEKAGQVAQDVNDNKIVPGGTLYSESYDGFTFKLIAGSGTIEIDEIVENTHEFHLIIGTNKPITLNGNNSIIRPYDGKSVRVQAEIAFNVGAPTYCFLYMVKKTAGTRGTRLGKRDKAHGKLVSVQVRSTTVIPTEPPSEATGGVMDEKDDPEVETVPGPPTPPTGIKFVNSDKMAVKSGWYTIDGQKIAEPTQRGLYIKDGKKVVIK